MHLLNLGHGFGVQAEANIAALVKIIDAQMITQHASMQPACIKG